MNPVAISLMCATMMAGISWFCFNCKFKEKDDE